MFIVIGTDNITHLRADILEMSMVYDACYVSYCFELVADQTPLILRA